MGICMGNENGESSQSGKPAFEDDPTKLYESVLEIDFLQSPIIDVGREVDESLTHWLIKLIQSSTNENEIDLQLELTEIGDEDDESLDELDFDLFARHQRKYSYFRYNISLMDSVGNTFLRKENKKIIRLQKGDSWCEPGLLKKDMLKRQLDRHEDMLEIKLDIFVFNDITHSKSKSLEQGFPIFCSEEELFSISTSKKRKCQTSTFCSCWEKQLQLNQSVTANKTLNTLWETKSGCDAVIECGDEKFSVHKCVLSGASPVFYALFSHPMDENINGRVVISDLSPVATELLLRFIYCLSDPFDAKWRNVETVGELLYASEKYQMPHLKTICFTKLCEELALGNAAQITTLVHLFEPEDSSIRKFVYQYVISNIDVLAGVDNFKKKIKEIPAAFSPILLQIGEQSRLF